MTAIFWRLSPETQANLMSYQWEHFGNRLDEIAPPPAPVHDKALEPAPDPELVREMKQVPHSPRQIV